MLNAANAISRGGALLSFFFFSPLPSLAEPDDTPAGAYLVPNPYPRTADRISVPGDLDWYKADLPAGSQLTWRIYSDSVGLTLTVLVYGTAEQTTGLPKCLLTINSGNNDQCPLTAGIAGYYYMVVAAQPGQTGNYSVRTSYTSPATDTAPPSPNPSVWLLSHMDSVPRRVAWRSYPRLTTDRHPWSIASISQRARAATTDVGIRATHTTTPD